MAGAKQSWTGDFAVIGGGLSGLISALAAANRGLSVALAAPPLAEPDGRTTALLADSIAFLKEIGLWEAMEPIAHPLRTMRILDGTNRLIRAPQADFRASEIGLDAFGYNLENKVLAAMLHGQISASKHISVFEEPVVEFDETAPGQHAATLQSGMKIAAKAYAAADGRNSMIRQQLAITCRQWRYPQVALVANLEHTLDHHDTSTEFHTETGPLTLVPLGVKRSSLVIVLDEAGADALLALNEAALARELEERMHSVLGKLKLVSPVGKFPLSSALAGKFGKDDVMLIGEAGHAFPPIGAQGLNLGIRDIRTAVALAGEPLRPGLPPAGERYHRRRAADIASRTASVDLLNRSLLSAFLPVQAVRAAGLYLLANAGPMRRLMMREGVLPGMGLQNLSERLRGGLKPSAMRERST
ncbi:UbiH/UbiF family hydroxylase [Salaquimonas pukyongi]|uniref:UbiH/UbiF family hydroxylase n=1 Tax=Salaquimonas pukyongi TaxID=2712698 RepID=UPI00096B8443|nr:UbiH/UbiF family hydroxylase [Salaquimonas pukyongi]